MHTLPKLSPRLHAIFSLIQQVGPVDYVWDGCCDHGYLGMHILDSKLSGHLFFVDQLEHIIAPLAAKLSHLGLQGYSLLTMDCGQLSLMQPGSRLVVIAGVGGRALVDMLRSLKQRHQGQRLQFIVCAANCVYELREYLAAECYSLLSEQIVSDRGRQYEVIHLGLNGCGHEKESGEERVTAVGKMWQQGNKDHLAYQQRLLAHYQRQVLNSDSLWLQGIIAAYERCL